MLRRPWLEELFIIFFSALEDAEDAEDDETVSDTTITNDSFEYDAESDAAIAADKSNLDADHVPVSQCISRMSRIHSSNTITLPCSCTFCRPCLVATFNTISWLKLHRGPAGGSGRIRASNLYLRP